MKLDDPDILQAFLWDFRVDHRMLMVDGCYQGNHRFPFETIDLGLFIEVRLEGLNHRAQGAPGGLDA